MIARLLDIVLPDGGFVVALAEAYFDESGTDEGNQFLCVAGYVFKKENALKLGIEWRKMLGKYDLPYFHMSECAHRVGIYQHLTKEDCDNAAREAIRLTKLYASKGIAVSLDKQAYALIPKDGLFDNPYALVCGQVFFGVRDWADETGFNGDVAYFFESGANGFGNANSAMHRMYNEPKLRSDFRWGSHIFIEKERAIPLQCADLLAWHWLTHNKRIQKGEKIRKDFKSLIECRVDAHHYDKETIGMWLRELKNDGSKTPN